MDGATRGQCIRYLTLPLLKSTAVMLFIMNVGKIFNGDFGMIYNLVGNNSLLYRTTDVIDTYVYRMLVESTNIGQSAAVSFYQSVMGFIIVMATNALTKKLDPDSHYSEKKEVPMAKQISEAAHSAKNKIKMTPGDRVLNLFFYVSSPSSR